MHLTNTILTALDIDSSDFFYNNSIKLYDKNSKKPYGKVTFEKGHYKLTVGDLSLSYPTYTYDYQ